MKRYGSLSGTACQWLICVWLLVGAQLLWAAGGITYSSNSTYRLWEQAATALDVPANERTITWDRLFTLYPNDDDQVTLPIGFNFQFGSSSYSSVKVLTNGLLQFYSLDLLYLDYSNDPIPTSSGSRYIAAYWDDLVDDDQAKVTWGTMGTAPERRFVVTWYNVRAYANNLRYDFQLVLYENGDIRLRYNNNQANGQSATIGLEVSGTDYVQYSHNQSSVSTSFDLVFRNRNLMLPDPVAWYSLDADSYSGVASEVKDISGNQLHGIATHGASTGGNRSAISGTIGTCRYGYFDGVDDYIEIADNNLLDQPTAVAVGAWVRFDAVPSGDIRTVVSKDENYEFHIDQSGRVYWWWVNPFGWAYSLTSNISLTAGTWYHIAVSYRSGYQAMYVNGALVASATVVDTLQVNSDPIQIGGDQGMAGRYFQGSIDEVMVFNQALSQNQVLEMMRKTRPCPAFNLCIGSFPDGLASYSGGTITFADNAQLFFSPTDKLYAGTVSNSATSSLLSCVSVSCTASAQKAPYPPEQTFQTTVQGNNVTIPASTSSNLGGSPTYQRIAVGDNATAVFGGGRSQYVIDSIVTGTGSVLQLEPATYWVRNLSLGANNRITVSGAGAVRLFVQDSMTTGTGLLANSPGAVQTGDVSLLLLYGYNNVTIGSGSTFSGVVFARGNYTQNSSSYLFGAVTAANLTLGSAAKVYYDPNTVADTEFGAICSSSTPCVLGGFQVTQPAYGLACPDSRMAIAVQAMCTDGINLKTDYEGTIRTSTNNSSSSSFYPSTTATSAATDFVLAGWEGGQTTVYLEHRNEQPQLLVTATDLSTGLSGSGSAVTDVRTSGFQVVTQPSAMTCGGNTSLAIVAVGQNQTATACQQLTGFTGTKNLKAWFSASVTVPPEATAVSTVTTPLLINGTSITAQQQPASTNLALAFNSGRADLQLAYANSAQITGLNLRYDTTPHDGSSGSSASNAGIGPLLASTNGWVVRPQQVKLSLLNNSTCASVSSSCSPMVRAGDNFAIEARAECSDGSLATDYRGTVNLASLIQLPAGGNNPAPLPSSFSIAAANGGRVQQNISLSETGIFTLVSSGSYQGTALSNYNLASVGRVVPHHFRIVAPVLSQSCSSFTYMGQPGINAGFHIQAENATNSISLNYQGSLAKATLGWVAEQNNNGSDLSGRLAGGVNPVWNAGEADVVTDLLLNRGSAPENPLDNLAIGVSVADNDGGWSPLVVRDMYPAATGDCATAGNCSALTLGTANLLYGRLQLNNASGPELEDLRQDIELQYYLNNRWLVNSADSCSSLSLGSMVVDSSSAEGNLVAGETVPTLMSGVSSGSAYVMHSAPGLDNNGSLLYRYQAPAWLLTETSGDDNYQDYPQGRVIFGGYRGNDRVIYWREQTR